MKKTEIEVIGLCFFRIQNSYLASLERLFAERIFRFQNLVFGFFFHGSRNIAFEHTCYAGCPAVDGVVVHL